MIVFLQMHADDFRQDRYGVVSGLKDGGYSDDMTLAAIAGTSLVLLSNFFDAISTLIIYIWWTLWRSQTNETREGAHKRLIILIIPCIEFYYIPSLIQVPQKNINPNILKITIMLSFAGAHKRLITSPPVAVFPHPLATDLNFGRFVTFNHLKNNTSFHIGWFSFKKHVDTGITWGSKHSLSSHIQQTLTGWWTVHCLVFTAICHGHW